MRTQLISLGILVLGGMNAGAQDRPFVFAHTDTAQAREQVRSILATVCEIPVTLDIGKGTLTVGGTAVQRGVAEWIFAELDTDKPATVKREYAIPGASNDVVQILRPTHIVQPREVQETVTALRVLAEVRLVAAAFSPPHAIVLRGTQAQLKLTEWLTEQMDTTVAGPAMRATDFDDQSKIPVQFHATAVRVFYLRPSSTPANMQELINAIRSISELQRVVAFSEQHEVLVRGTLLQVKLAEWLVQQLDSAPGAGGMRATIFDGDLAPPGRQSPAVRVFYRPAATSAELQEAVDRLRREAKLPRVVGFSAHPAIVIRGTDEQAAAAEQLMR
jgi:hypothetical protein